MKLNPQTQQGRQPYMAVLEAHEQVVFVRLTRAIYDFKFVQLREFGEFDFRYLYEQTPHKKNPNEVRI